LMTKNDRLYRYQPGLQSPVRLLLTSPPADSLSAPAMLKWSNNIGSAEIKRACKPLAVEDFVPNARVVPVATLLRRSARSLDHEDATGRAGAPAVVRIIALQFEV
jgi:hypothetical protein